MPKTKISEFSATPGNNTDIDGINIAEGCAPSGINDAIRELMAQLKDFQAGTAGDSFNGPVGTTTAAAGAFTTLSASSTVSGAGFSTYLASPPAIGGTAAAAGSFTTLSASGTLSLTGGLSSTSSAISYAVFSSSLANGGRLEIKDGANLVGYIGNGANSIGAASASEFCVNGNSRILFGIAGNSKLTLNSSSFALDSTVSMTVNSGTANGVAYLNGSKVLTTGSALTFDGTNLATTGSGTVKNLLLTAGTLPGAGNPSISLRSADNVVYHQSGSANTIVMLDSAQNTMQSIGATAQIWNISNAEAMRLTSTGLGIGTSSPNKGSWSKALTLEGASNEAYELVTNGTYMGWFAAGGSSVTIGTKQANPFVFFTSDTERMRLDSSGNLGLGVTPSAWNSDYRTMQFGATGLLYGRSGGEVAFGTNWYRNAGGSFLYANNGYASYQAQASGVHYWFTAPSGTAGNAITFTQAMTLDSSGNLGVGTTSPAYRLEAAVGTAGSGQQSIANFRTADSTASYNAGVQIYATPSATATSRAVNVIWDADGANSSGGDYFYINKLGNSGEVQLSQNSNAAMLFATNATERARITSGGDFLVGTTDTSASTGSGLKFIKDVNGANSSQVAIVTAASGSTTSSLSLYSTGAAAYRFYVVDSGTIYATSNTITAISDQRLKENIQDLDAGLDKIMALKPRKFDWKAGKGKDKKGDRGWIAQEFEQVFPDMVQEWLDPAPEGEEPYKAVNADLIPVLVKAMQEQQVMINELKAKVAALEAK